MGPATDQRTPAAPALPLSDAQARLLDLEAHLGGGSVHVFALAYELEGSLDAHALGTAIAEVTALHQALRIRVDTENGAPCFVATRPPALERRALPDGSDDHAYRALLRHEAASPISITTGAGWRALLIERGPERFTFVVQFHHVIADRASVGVFMADLGAAYRRITHADTRSEAPRSVTPLSSRAIGGSDAEQVTAYWQSLFTPSPEPLAIPGARARADFQNYEGARVEAHLAADATAGLKQAADAQQTSLYSALLAAFAATLHAHTGQRDLVVCTPMVGRHRAGTRKAIGYFNNIVPLRLDLGGDPSFGEMMTRASQQLRGALEHQDLPFHQIAAMPELAGTRLTQCLFALQNISGLRLDLPNVRCRYFDIPNGTANFDVALFIEEMDGGLVLMLDYKSRVVPGDAAARLLQRYVEVLRLIAAQPGIILSGIPRFARAASAGTPVEAMPAVAEPARDTRDTELERRIIALWREIFASPKGKHTVEISAESHFLRMGGDSIRAARLFKRIKEEFGHDLPLATLLEAPTPRAIAERLSNEAWVAPWLSLLPVKTTGSRPPLFCLHGGGGNVLQFGFIAERLHPDQPLYCLQPYELTRGDLSSVEAMAEHYLLAIRKLRPHGPYLFAGASLGGAVVYEMAQRLMAQGEPVPFIALLDYAGPHLRTTLRDEISDHLLYTRHLSLSGKLEYVTHIVRRKLGRRASGPPPAQLDADAQAGAELMEASVRALKNYVVRPYPGRVTMFRATEGPRAVVSDPQGGWGGLTGGVDIVDLKGDHMTLTHPPQIFTVAGQFSDALEQSWARAHASGDGTKGT